MLLSLKLFMLDLPPFSVTVVSAWHEKYICAIINLTFTGAILLVEKKISIIINTSCKYLVIERILNLNLKELITKIEQEEVEFIQEEVLVQYDQSQQVPLAFIWRDSHCEVLKLLHAYKSIEEHF